MSASLPSEASASTSLRGLRRFELRKRPSRLRGHEVIPNRTLEQACSPARTRVIFDFASSFSKPKERDGPGACTDLAQVHRLPFPTCFPPRSTSAVGMPGIRYGFGSNTMRKVATSHSGRHCPTVDQRTRVLYRARRRPVTARGSRGRPPREPKTRRSGTRRGERPRRARGTRARSYTRRLNETTTGCYVDAHWNRSRHRA
jgi:hypothetical protein